MLKINLKRTVTKISAILLFITSIGAIIFYFSGGAVLAVTINVSTVIAAGGVSASSERVTAQRKIVTSSNGTIIDFYQGAANDAGAGTAAGINFRTSTNGTSWSSATQVDSKSVSDFSVAIDPSDNIWVLYAQGGTANLKELTYGSGSWSVPGSITKSWASSTCVAGSNDGHSYADMGIAANSSGNIVVSMGDSFSQNRGLSCGPSSQQAYDLWNGSWHGLYVISNLTTNYCPVIAIGAGFWTMCDKSGAVGTTQELWKDLTPSGSWTDTTQSVTDANGIGGQFSSLTNSSSTQIDYASYANADGHKYYHCTISGSPSNCGAFSSSTLDASSNFGPGALSADPNSGKLWYFYPTVTNQTTIVYKESDNNGTSWNANVNIVTSESTGLSSLMHSELHYTAGHVSTGWVTSSGDIRLAELLFQNPPNTPNLNVPSANKTGVSLTPTFQFSDTDPNNDDIQFQIYIYQSDCSMAAFAGSAPYTEPNGGTWTTEDGTATHTYKSTTAGNGISFTPSTSLSAGTQYCWKVAATDPSGSNSTTTSGTQLFTTNAAPAPPTLYTPSSGATSISSFPVFQVRTTDADSDYVQYELRLYSNSGGTGSGDCAADTSTSGGGTNFVQAMNQTSAQTGWTQQNANSNTAYTTSASNINNSAVAMNIYDQSFAALTLGNTYYWKARAQDPGGSQTWSSWSACQSFATGTQQTFIHGNVNIHGNTNIHP